MMSFISRDPHSNNNTQFTDKETENCGVKVIISALANQSVVELDYKPEAWGDKPRGLLLWGI